MSLCSPLGVREMLCCCICVVATSGPCGATEGAREERKDGTRARKDGVAARREREKIDREHQARSCGSGRMGNDTQVRRALPQSRGRQLGAQHRRASAGVADGAWECIYAYARRVGGVGDQIAI